MKSDLEWLYDELSLRIDRVATDSKSIDSVVCVALVAIRNAVAGALNAKLDLAADNTPEMFAANWHREHPCPPDLPCHYCHPTE